MGASSNGERMMKAPARMRKWNAPAALWRANMRLAGRHVGAPGQFTKVVMLLDGNEMENAFALTAIADSRSNVAPAVVR